MGRANDVGRTEPETVRSREGPRGTRGMMNCIGWWAIGQSLGHSTFHNSTPSACHVDCHELAGVTFEPIVGD